MNVVALVGRLVGDPEIRYSQGANSTAFGNFTIAVDRNVKRDPNNPDQVTADFPRIRVFGKTAEFVQNYFHKGMRIGITGRIQTGKYTDKNGQTVYTTDVVADRVEFVENKNGDGGGGYQANQQPQQNNDYGRQNDPVNNYYNGGFTNIPDGVDEQLPFN